MDPRGYPPMISIQSSLTELERSHQFREAVLECYLSAVKNVSHYALELDEEVTRQFRKHISGLVEEIFLGKVDLLAESRATLRGLLRDFRDRNSAYVANRRDEWAGTARALDEILDTLAQTDGDSETRMRAALGKLRSAVASDPSSTLRAVVSGAAAAIEQSIEQMRKQQQLTVSQLITEIRVLHKRIRPAGVRRQPRSADPAGQPQRNDRADPSVDFRRVLPGC